MRTVPGALSLTREMKSAIAQNLNADLFVHKMHVSSGSVVYHWQLLWIYKSLENESCSKQRCARVPLP